MFRLEGVMPFRGDRLRDLREKAGLSQTQLAELANTTQTGITRYETGKREPPSDILERITKALHTNGAFLHDFTDDPREGIVLVALSPDENVLFDALRSGDQQTVNKIMLQRFRKQLGKKK